jgi:hypothetical protein
VYQCVWAVEKKKIHNLFFFLLSEFIGKPGIHPRCNQRRSYRRDTDIAIVVTVRPVPWQEHGIAGYRHITLKRAALWRHWGIREIVVFSDCPWSEFLAT